MDNTDNFENDWVAGEDDWEHDCLKSRGVILTGKGSHWCAAWDGLPIDETCGEWPCCEYARNTGIQGIGFGED